MCIRDSTCPECDGTRLNETARSSKIGDYSIADVCAMQISDVAEWVRTIDDPGLAPLVAKLADTLDSFVQIGLGYLSLERPTGTLSGGESQRTKMIRHLGSPITDATYVFDEPSIGLHPHDIQRMNQLLLKLRDKGNTVLVVEHKPEMIAIADHVVDLGPVSYTHLDVYKRQEQHHPKHKHLADEKHRRSEHGERGRGSVPRSHTRVRALGECHGNRLPRPPDVCALAPELVHDHAKMASMVGAG